MNLRAAAVLLLAAVATACVVSTSDVKDLAATCTSTQSSCEGRCVDLQTSSTDCGGCGLKCAGGSSCSDGRCETYDVQACNATTAPPWFKLCGGGCSDTNADAKNCGGCGNACGTDQQCDVGSCGQKCNPPLKFCGSGCVDPDTDKDNCGRCGTQCSDSQRCEFGVCE